MASAKVGNSGMSMVKVTISIRADELDGGFVACVEELPGCVSEGETHDEALDNVLDALVSYLQVQHAPCDVELVDVKRSERRGHRTDKHPAKLQLVPQPA